MKKVLILTSAVFMLASCGTQQQVNFLPNSSVISASTVKSFSHNPEFTRKLKEKSNYKVKVTTKQTRSICGKNDLQEINSYDGKLGASLEFVADHKNPVGALESKNTDNSSKFCSGTLIGEDLFLTASHCVDSSITKKFVSFNYEKEKGSETLLPQTHVKILKIEEEGASKNIDYAILRLEGKPGAKFGFTKIRTATPEKGSALTIIQHPSGETKQIEAGTTGNIADVYMGYGDLDTEPGSSGSGVLDKDGFVTAVHTNGGCGSSSGENTGVRLAKAVTVSKLLKELDNPATPPSQP